MSAATPRILDMSEALQEGEQDDRLRNSRGNLLTAKQIRARARRAKGRDDKKQVRDDVAHLHKPIEEWDMEELARGRPRSADGTFKGRVAAYVSREIHEAAIARFKDMVRQGMNANAIQALQALDNILSNDEIDRRDRPIIPASVKLQAATYLLDHVVGRAVQPTQSEISVKLQAILGSVMVSPSEVEGAFQVGQVASRGVIEMTQDAEIVLDGEDDEDDN